MKRIYMDDEMLPLSGIQHFRFCPRQWALIHIDMQWEENGLTMEGHILHENADNPSYRNRHGEKPSLRAVSLSSQRLGLYGLSDVVELIETKDLENSIIIEKLPGRWIPYPVEYKRGRRKRNRCDILQLAAQVLCLEEKYNILISRGALYYASEHRRMEVEIDNNLRQEVLDICERMHAYFTKGVIPCPEYEPKCKNCSVINLCCPNINSGKFLDDYISILRI